MVIHILKDGTQTTELKDVTVPAEIVERIYSIVKGNGNEKVSHQKRKHSR